MLLKQFYLFFCLTYIVVLQVTTIAGPIEKSLVIQRVTPGKIIYGENQPAIGVVVIENTSNQKLDAMLEIRDQWGVVGDRLIEKLPIQLQPNQVKNYDFTWNSGNHRYGHALVARVIRDNLILDEKSEFYSVIDDWWRVQMIVSDFGKHDASRKRIYDWYHLPYEPYEQSFYPSDDFDPKIGPFMGYGNHAMRFASMPSFFGKLVPPDVAEDITWYSGRGWYPFRTDRLREDVELCKRWGFRNSMFTISMMSGRAGFELARRDPHLVGRTDSGAFADAGYASPDPLQLAKPETESVPDWYALLPELYREETIRFGAQAIVDSIREFGWDGVFFDGGGYVVTPAYNGQGEALPGEALPDQVSARNIRLTRDIIREAFPNTFLWYNGANPGHVGPFYPAGNGGGRAGKLEMISDLKSGSLKEMQSGQMIAPGFPAHSWRGAFDIYLGERNDLRLRDWSRPVTDVIITGGLNPEGFRTMMSSEAYERTRAQWAWANHAMSVMAAAGIHPKVNGSGFRPMLQLLTRYSRFLWAEDVQIILQAYKHFAVDSLREVWWADAVYQIQGDGYTDTVICLVNTPEEDTAHINIERDPPAADDVEISILAPKTLENVRAWAIQPYDYESEILEPVQTELESSVIEDELVFTVPPFHYFSMVIIRESNP